MSACRSTTQHAMTIRFSADERRASLSQAHSGCVNRKWVRPIDLSRFQRTTAECRETTCGEDCNSSGRNRDQSPHSSGRDISCCPTRISPFFKEPFACPASAEQTANTCSNTPQTRCMQAPRLMCMNWWTTPWTHGARREKALDRPHSNDRDTQSMGSYMNFCPPISAATISPELLAVKIATPRL